MRLYKSKKNVKGGSSSQTPSHTSQRHLYKNQNHSNTVSHARQIGDLTRKTIILRNTASIEYYHNIVINSNCNELPVDINDPNKIETDKDILHIKNTIYDKPFKKIIKQINQTLQMDEIQKLELNSLISKSQRIKSGTTNMTTNDNRTTKAELLKRIKTVRGMILNKKTQNNYQKHKTDMIAFLSDTNKIYKLLIGNIRNIHNILIEYYTVKHTEPNDPWEGLLAQLNEKELNCENRENSETGGTRFKNKKGSNKKGLNKKGPNKKGSNKKGPNKKGSNKKRPNKKGPNRSRIINGGSSTYRHTTTTKPIGISPSNRETLSDKQILHMEQWLIISTIIYELLPYVNDTIPISSQSAQSAQSAQSVQSSSYTRFERPTFYQSLRTLVGKPTSVTDRLGSAIQSSAPPIKSIGPGETPGISRNDTQFQFINKFILDITSLNKWIEDSLTKIRDIPQLNINLEKFKAYEPPLKEIYNNYYILLYKLLQTSKDTIPEGSKPIPRNVIDTIVKLYRDYESLSIFISNIINSIDTHTKLKELAKLPPTPTYNPRLPTIQTLDLNPTYNVYRKVNFKSLSNYESVMLNPNENSIKNIVMRLYLLKGTIPPGFEVHKKKINITDF